MEEKKHIGQLFDRIAGTYDGLNHLLSANIDRRWRRIAVRKMVGGEHILDVAIGTADLTIEMLRRQKAKQVTGIDLSQKMMEIGKRKIERAKEVETDTVTFVYGNAQAMPFEEASFDGVTCAFGCRNFQNLDEEQKNRVFVVEKIRAYSRNARLYTTLHLTFILVMCCR